MFFKYLNVHASAGLLFALQIIHLMKAVFFFGLNIFSYIMYKKTLLIFQWQRTVHGFCSCSIKRRLA